jgi:Raf kinase inhibitor-like YbhB/YbcL family protein
MRASENMRLGRELWQAAQVIAAGLLLLAASLRGYRVYIARGQTMNLSSTSFQDGLQIPAKFTCSGAGISPQLAWTAPPAKTASLALIVTDPDAPRGTWVHWVLYNLPAAGTRALPEGLPALDQLPDGALQGRNDFGKIGYGGPCPPPGSPHHYVFTLYALDAKLNLPVGATRAQVEAAMQGHILASGRLVGMFQRYAANLLHAAVIACPLASRPISARPASVSATMITVIASTSG